MSPIKLIFIFFFLIIHILLLSENKEKIYAIENLSSICEGGRYDYCSQAPKCGEYKDKSYQWFMDNISSRIFILEIFQYCQERNCDGYVPLCCYEMERTGDKDMCAGLDTLYCMPSQCDKAPGSYAKNCAHGSLYWCRNRRGIDARTITPVPLSNRFPNDVLFYLIDQNPQAAASWVPQKYPDIWNKYLQWKQGSSTPTPTRPYSSPTAPFSPTVTLSSLPDIYPTSVLPSYSSQYPFRLLEVTNAPKAGSNQQPTPPPLHAILPQNLELALLNKYSITPITNAPINNKQTHDPEKFFVPSPIKLISEIKNNLSFFAVRIYNWIIQFSQKYLP